VELAAVGFEDQAGIAPKEVRHQRGAADRQVAVHLGQRQSRIATKIQDPRLELETGELFARVVMGDRRPQASDTSPPPAAIQELSHRNEVEMSLGFGLGYGVSQLAKGDDGREIEKRPGHRGAGNAVDIRSVGPGERAVAVGVDSRRNAATAAGRGHIDSVAGVISQSPERRSRAMGENRLRTARNHRRHSMAMGGEQRVTDRIDAYVNAMEATRGNPSSNGTLMPAQLNQLPQGYDSVLSRSQIGDPTLMPCPLPPPTGRFRSIFDRFRPVGGGRFGGDRGHAGSVACMGACVARRRWRKRHEGRLAWPGWGPQTTRARLLPGPRRALACWRQDGANGLATSSRPCRACRPAYHRRRSPPAARRSRPR
jgi:hypothetical protein